MTDTHPHWLFVYGTLKSGHGNNPLLVRHNAKPMGVAYTVGKLILNDGFPFVWQVPDNRAAKMEPYLGRVKGELYRVTDSGLDACDALEGHPIGYCRTPIEVEYFMEGGGETTVTAGIYLQRWRDSYMDGLQKPNERGMLEWGRDRPVLARNFQRNSGKRFIQRK